MYLNAKAAFRGAVRDSIGVPSAVLAAGYFGFGALITGVEFPLWAGAARA